MVGQRQSPHVRGARFLSGMPCSAGDMVRTIAFIHSGRSGYPLGEAPAVSEAAAVGFQLPITNYLRNTINSVGGLDSMLPRGSRDSTSTLVGHTFLTIKIERILAVAVFHMKNVGPARRP